MSMGSYKKIKAKLKKIRNSGKTKNFMGFLIFVLIAAFFWLFMVLNETHHKTFELKLSIEDLPDSVTFITDLPPKVQVTINDRGFNLLRYSYIKDNSIKLNFEGGKNEGVYTVSRAELSSAVKNVFGSGAIVTNITPESIQAEYVVGAGEKFPIIPVYNIECMPGMTLSGMPKLSVDTAVVYSTHSLDTITAIYTEPIVLRKVDKPVTVKAELKQMPGIKAMPQTISVTFDVEQLVKKTVDVIVKADYIPAGQDILFFPSRVRVSYYVPMNKYTELNDDDIEVMASFREAVESSSDKVSVKVTRHAYFMKNVEIPIDSVEYTLVRGD